MGKLLIWVVVILAVLVIIRVVAARNRARQDAPPTAARPPSQKAGKTESESMVRCAHCGIHLPRSEATLLNGKTWCGSEHAQLGER